MRRNSALFPSVEWHMIALMAPCSALSNGEGGDIRGFFVGETMRKKYVLRRAVWKQERNLHSAEIGMKSNIMFLLQVYETSEVSIWKVKMVFCGDHYRQLASGQSRIWATPKDRCENIVFGNIKKIFCARGY